MKEPYIEAVAKHDDPESCVYDRKGVGEALTGAHAGPAIEPRNQAVWGVDAVIRGRRQHHSHRHREARMSPARSANRRTHGHFLRENREVPSSPMPDGRMGRIGKVKAVRR